MKPIIHSKSSFGRGTRDQRQHPFLLNYNLAASPLTFMGLNRIGKTWEGVLSLCLIHTSNRFVHLELDDHWNDHPETTWGSF